MQLKKLRALSLVLSLAGSPLIAWPAHTAPVTCTARDDTKFPMPPLPGACQLQASAIYWSFLFNTLE
jgi:hypothetical protein